MALTDFNDLHVAVGLPAVRTQLLAALESIANSGSSGPDAERVPANTREQRYWADGFSRTSTGQPRSDIFNTGLVLQHDYRWRGVLGYCDFSYRVIKRRPPPFPGGVTGEWTDSDTDRFRIWLTEFYGFTPKNADADGAIMVAAEAARFHPVRDYLERCKWDRVNRLDFWLHWYLGAEQNSYTMAVGRKWLIAAVARVMEPPVKADCVMILEGQQGVGKSSAFRVLGGDWFSDTHFALGDKDGYQQMQGVWICELAELDSFNKAESTRAKQFFASESDRYRPAYGRRAVEFARQCVFGGSTNQDAYLRDATGNRRYWPVSVTKVDLSGLADFRDQLWAEAVSRYRAGEPWHAVDAERSVFEREQDARFDVDVWEELIGEWLISQSSNKVLISEVMQDALKMEPGFMKKPEQMRVGQIMLRLGWRKIRSTNGDGKRETGYEAPIDWRPRQSMLQDQEDAVSGF